jgi:hypothetical protein
MGTARQLIATAALVVGAPTVALAGTTPAPPAPPAPRVSAVVMPTVVTGRQGHVRFLAGVRTRTEARVIVRLISTRTRKVVATAKTPGRHAKGRAWLLVQAVTPTGLQLPAGGYTAEVYAVDALKRRSNTIRRPLTIRFKAPKGIVQAFTVPAWPSILAGVANPGAAGQIVAAVAPGSAIATAGLRRGDVIRTVAGRSVDGRGAWIAALRALNANTPVPIGYERAGIAGTLQYTPPPDWSPAVDLRAPLLASIAANPGVLAYMYAAVRERLDARATAAAKTLYGGWAAAQKTTAPGEFLSGAIAAAENAPVATAAGAFNRALAADPTMAAAQFAMGVARSAAGQNDRAITAFTAAMDLDATDGVAATFSAFALLRADRFAEALTAADVALNRDVRYEEARIARGLALIGLGRTAEGVANLKIGLTLMDNATRAQQIITSSLEPNAP